MVHAADRAAAEEYLRAQFGDALVTRDTLTPSECRRPDRELCYRRYFADDHTCLYVPVRACSSCVRPS